MNLPRKGFKEQILLFPGAEQYRSCAAVLLNNTSKKFASAQINEHLRQVSCFYPNLKYFSVKI